MSNNEVQPKNYRILIISGVFLILIGGLMVVFGISFVREGNESSSWPVAEGEVAGIRVRWDSSDSNQRYYYYEVSYLYTVDGLPYTADRFSLGGGSTASKKFGSDEEARADAAEKYPAGSLVLVSYDPDDPGSAVLKPGADWGTYMPLVIGLFFLAVGIALLYLAIKARPR